MDSDLRNAVLGKKRSALLVAKVGQKKHWPNGRVPFLIDNSLSTYVCIFFFGIMVKAPFIDVFKCFKRWHHNFFSS